MGTLKKSSKPEQPSEKSSFKNLSEVYRELSPYLNIGYIFLVAVLLFTYIGYKVDEWKGTAPWFTLLGAIMGIVVGFYQFFKIVLGRSKKHNGNNGNLE